MAPVSTPVIKPRLPSAGIPWRSVHTDYFGGDTLGVWWHFLNRKAAGQYSLSARKGWLHLAPDSNRAHLLQKETDHYYTAITRVDLGSADTAGSAGIYLTNGNEKTSVQLYTGFDKGKRIIFRFDTAVRSMANPVNGPVWLKLERQRHALTGYYSGDGRSWISLGAAIDAVPLDKVQPNYNSWVGTSVGIFAEGKGADFDLFVCKDAFSPLTAAGYSNYFGVEAANNDGARAVTNTSPYGGWFMLSGVSLGEKKDDVSKVQALVAARKGGMVEIWLDDLRSGRMIARVPVTPTDGKWITCVAAVKNISGSHDVFVKFPSGDDHDIYIRQLTFTQKK
jgi:hypothetical protein